MTKQIGLFASILAAGCGAATLSSHAREHGELFALARSRDLVAAEASQARQVAPLVVLVEAGRIVAIDPRTARVQWSRAIDATGHMVASPTGLYVPTRGQGLVGLDRQNGAVRFDVQLPGDALIGLTVAEPVVVATVLEHHAAKYRAQVLALATEDGAVRWRQKSRAPLGVPDARGSVVAVPVGDQIAALRITDGHELARRAVPTLRSTRTASTRITHVHGDWLAGNGVRWVDLADSGGALQELAHAYAPVFGSIEGLDAGHGDDERLRLWLRHGGANAMPRDAILLSRSVVIAFRLDAQGRPLQGRWIHREDAGEFVAMEVVGRRVVLVREDGAIVQLSDDDGRVVDRVAPGSPVRGAVILGVPARRRGNPSRARQPDLAAELAWLVRDPDFRRFPAQRLAIDLLWRNPSPVAREVVTRLATGAAAPGSFALAGYAAYTTDRPWGPASEGELEARLETLRKPPPPDGEFSQELRHAIVESRSSASVEVAKALGQLLLEPSTPPGVRAEILEALATMPSFAAATPVAAFVRQAHLDAGAANTAALTRTAQRLLTAWGATVAQSGGPVGFGRSTLLEH